MQNICCEDFGINGLALSLVLKWPIYSDFLAFWRLLCAGWLLFDVFYTGKFILQFLTQFFCGDSTCPKLFTVPDFSVWWSRSKTLRHCRPSWMSLKSTWGLWTVHIKPRWPLVPMSTRSWRCNEKTGACEQSPLTQNITTIQTSHGQRGAFPSAARDCTFLCAVKKVRYNSRRGEILVNTFPFLFTLTGVSQCTGTIWQTGRIKIWPMRRELLDKKYPLYGGRVSRVPPWLMLCGNTKF